MVDNDNSSTRIGLLGDTVKDAKSAFQRGLLRLLAAVLAFITFFSAPAC